jgi:hypothetical protein
MLTPFENAEFLEEGEEPGAGVALAGVEELDAEL